MQIREKKETLNPKGTGGSGKEGCPLPHDLIAAMREPKIGGED